MKTLRSIFTFLFLLILEKYLVKICSIFRGHVRNFDLRVPLLNRGFTLESLLLDKSQNYKVPGTRGTRSNVAPVVNDKVSTYIEVISV